MWEGDVWVAVRAARAGADIVQTGFFNPLETEMKGSVDPVTQIDEDSERAIRAVIASHFPDDSILGEEGGGGDWRHGRVWIIDPLDGTVNYVNRIPQVAISVALWEDGEPLVGVIIDAARNEEFVAASGKGASVDGKEIHVSQTARLEDSVLVTGFPYDRREHGSSYLAVLGEIMTRSRGTRRMGAAALDLAWVACGRFDGYWEHGGSYGVKPWDLAAGSLLVTEAGGAFTNEAGDTGELEARAHIASNGKVHEDLREIIANTMPEHLR